MSTIEAKERSSDRTENGKCTNVTNGIQLTPFYTFFSNLPDGENGFSKDARCPPEVKFTPQNLQMLFFRMSFFGFLPV